MKRQTVGNRIYKVVIAALVVGLMVGYGAEAKAQYAYDDAYDPGGYAEGGYADPTPAPAPASGGGPRGIFGGSPNFRYGYLEGQYQWMSFSNDFFDTRGAYGGEFSLGGSGNLYLKGSGFYAPGQTEDFEDVSYIYGSLGPGLALPIGGALDLTFDGGVAYQGFDTLFSDIGDGWGFYLSPGLRVGLGDHFELNGGFRFLNVGDVSDFTLNLGAHIYLTDNIVIVGSADFGDEISTFGVGLRLNF